MNQDSLRKRYFSRLTSSSIKLGLGFVTIGLVPRALGPVDFGSFSFLTNIFTTTTKFLKFGFSDAYYIKLSRRQHEKKIIGFFVYYVFISVVLLTIGTYGIIKFGFQEIIWPDQKETFIYAAVIYAVLVLISETNRVTVDALGYTVKLEMKIVLQSFIFTILIIILYFTNTLTLRSYFLLHYSILIFIILSGWRILSKNKILLIEQFYLTKNEITVYTKEFFTYSHPLFINSLVVFFISIFDRWILQKYYGSEEQGYYALGLKISAVFFLFSASMSTLLLRDMAQSYINRDKREIRRLFKKYIPLFYFLAAYFGVYISQSSETISYIIGGSDYKNASLVISILAFYPMHQTYGQLAGGLFAATEQTKTLRNVGASTGIIGFFITFLLLAPIEFYGFGMGAVGLALKIVIIQFIQVNILLFKGTRFLGLSFKKFISHQLLVVLILGSLVASSQFLSSLIIYGQNISSFLLSGFIYTIFTIIFIMSYPRIIVLKRNDLINYYKIVFNYIKRHHV